MHNLSDYSYDELVERIHVLDAHAEAMSTDPKYALQYIHKLVPDPFEGFEPGDPWYSQFRIEDHLEVAYTYRYFKEQEES